MIYVFYFGPVRSRNSLVTWFMPCSTPRIPVNTCTSTRKITFGLRLNCCGGSLIFSFHWVKHQEGLQTPMSSGRQKHAGLEGTLSRHPHRRSSVNYERTMKKPKKSFVLRRFQISKLTKLCCVFARYIWCGHSQTHPRLLRSQVKKGLGARLTSAIHWNSKKVMDMIQLLRAQVRELFGETYGFLHGFLLHEVNPQLVQKPRLCAGFKWLQITILSDSASVRNHLTSQASAHWCSL